MRTFGVDFGRAVMFGLGSGPPHQASCFQLPFAFEWMGVADRAWHCNGNEEIVYDMLWQGEAYTPEMAKKAQSAKENN